MKELIVFLILAYMLSLFEVLYLLYVIRYKTYTDTYLTTRVTQPAHFYRNMIAMGIIPFVNILGAIILYKWFVVKIRDEYIIKK